MSNRREIHDRVLQAADKHQLASAYAEWASTYDEDLVDEMGYRAFSIASDLLISHLRSSQARILDVGASHCTRRRSVFDAMRALARP